MNLPHTENGIPLPEPRPAKKQYLFSLRSGQSFSVPKQEAESWRVLIWGDSQLSGKFISRSIDGNQIRFWRK